MRRILLYAERLIDTFFLNLGDRHTVRYTYRTLQKNGVALQF